MRVPDVPPDRYLVALFDGSEGGTHYTWSYLNVEASGHANGNVVALVTVASVSALSALAAGGWLIRRRKRTRDADAGAANR